jgi:hypothetical protein
MRHAHRWVLAAPFLVLLIATAVGGQLNSVDARGRVVDDSTGLPVAGVGISYGQNRGAVSGDDGTYLLANLPRGARLKTNKPGYLPQTPAADVTEIRLVPGSLSLQVNEEGTMDERVPSYEVRQGDKVLAKCASNPCGQLTIDLTTGGIVGQKALVCAPAHESKEIELKGVTLVMTLQPKEGSACPPLPTPSPSPVPSPSPSVPPASPSPTASP